MMYIKIQRGKEKPAHPAVEMLNSIRGKEINMSRQRAKKKETYNSLEMKYWV